MKTSAAYIITLFIVLTVTLLPPGVCPKAYARTAALPDAGWTQDTRHIINTLITSFGNTSLCYDAANRPYAVFSFNDTVSIGNANELTAIYQLKNLRFAVSPLKLYDILTTRLTRIHDNLGTDQDPRTVYGVVSDIVSAYTRLYQKGYIAPDASRKHLKTEWLATADWKEFSAKALCLYQIVKKTQPAAISAPWLSYWMSGMTSAQANRLAADAFRNCKRHVKKGAFWKIHTWSSPFEYPNRQAGQTTVRFKGGFTVPPEIKTLFAALADNGIDIWICTSSPAEIVRCAVDAYGLPGVKGILGMKHRVHDGIYLNAMNTDLHSYPLGDGKSKTIRELLFPLYNGRGPLLTGVNAEDDFFMATEFNDTAACLIINRRQQGAVGALSALASHQSEQKLSLTACIAAGETRYLLQGRDENCGRFWKKEQSRLTGTVRPELLSPKAKSLLAMFRNGLPSRPMPVQIIRPTESTFSLGFIRKPQ